MRETVQDILDEMREHAKDGNFVNGYEVGRLADRIKVAHNRELYKVLETRLDEGRLNDIQPEKRVV